MPTFTLNGFTITDDTSAYVGATSFTLALPQDYVVRYAYSDTGNTPRFASIDIADRGIFIPEAFFGLRVNSPSAVAPHGNDDADEPIFSSCR